MSLRTTYLDGVFMYCTNCGVQNSDELNYCTNCGTKLVKAVNDVNDFNDNHSISENQGNTVSVVNENRDLSSSVHQANPYLNNAQEQNTYVNYQQGYCNSEAKKTENNKISRLSVAGFVLSCCSFLTFEVGWICMILGFIFSIIGLVSKNSQHKSGKCLAIAGIVISSSYLILLTVVIMTFGPFLGIILQEHYY